LFSGGQSSGVSKDVYKPSFDFGPSISGFDYLRGNSSKVGEVWWFDLDLSLSNVKYDELFQANVILNNQIFEYIYQVIEIYKYLLINKNK